jgi:ribosomal protein S18 acetylase RimI-like enzyme
MIEILKVSLKSDVESVAGLARKIWSDHYTPIIGSAQVEYMLTKFQSTEAIKQQIADGSEYYLASVDDVCSGYLAVIPDLAEHSLMISKIYVKKDVRRSGIGRSLLDFAEGLCNERGLRFIWLTVNKYNAGSIDWYERMGFVNAGAVVQDIGNGFVMDDYKMVKELGADQHG